MEKILIHSNTIKLVQLMKWAGLAESGAQAKEMISAGLISVNGTRETVPGKKITAGDIIGLSGQKYLVFYDEK